MNREEAKKFIKEISAFGEGKIIQWRENSFCSWKTDEYPQFYSFYEYRIKPEKKEVWLNIYSSDTVKAFLTRQEADFEYNNTTFWHDDERIACLKVTYEEGEGI